jgi:hypothetical protein
LLPYLSFIKSKKESKECGTKKEEKNEVIWFVSKTPMVANWVQIEMGMTSKTIKFHHKSFYVLHYKIFPFLM